MINPEGLGMEDNHDHGQEQDIHSEFQRLGNNLKAVFQGAWESEERLELQRDLQNGLQELGGSIRGLLDEFESSETGQQLKADVEDLRERVESGEAQAKARSELQHALDLANRELEKLAERWQDRED
jgi:hypothetical protein